MGNELAMSKVSKYPSEGKYPESKTEAEWKESLTNKQYSVIRLKGTEPPTSGEYDKFFPKKGFFRCAGCKHPLYSAAAKFNSGCGWPAFDKTFKGCVVTVTDNSHMMQRIEILCSNCGGHLGHVFSGERMTPTNERHCVNSISTVYDDGEIPAEFQTEDTVLKKNDL